MNFHNKLSEISLKYSTNINV